MERKIIKIGNSLGLIIPSSYLEELGVEQGDIIYLEMNKEMGAIVIKNKTTTPDTNYLEKVIKSVVDDYLLEKDL
jgi:putative addiction module antidote